MLHSVLFLFQNYGNYGLFPICHQIAEPGHKSVSEVGFGLQILFSSFHKRFCADQSDSGYSILTNHTLFIGALPQPVTMQLEPFPSLQQHYGAKTRTNHLRPEVHKSTWTRTCTLAYCDSINSLLCLLISDNLCLSSTVSIGHDFTV